jgi:hypothetical protein
MKLVDNVIRSMRVGKVFRDNQEGINHLHFSLDGASLISSSDDDQVRTEKNVLKLIRIYKRKYLYVQEIRIKSAILNFSNVLWYLI